MNPFVAWNLRLLQAYFSPASKGDEVWIAVNPEELDVLAPDLGGDEGFISAVRDGPPWPSVWNGWAYTAGAPDQFARRALGLWRQRRNALTRPRDYVDPGSCLRDYAGCSAPTYLPYLAALIRCASLRGGEKGYYERLRATYGLPLNWSTREMSELEELWKDLDTWSGAGGSPFGRFRFRQLGGYKYVGVPTSQSILSRRDLQELPRIFAQSGVRAGQRVSEKLIEEVRLTAASSPYLSAPFNAALNNDEFKVPVHERIRSLLEDWDGSVAVTERGSPAASSGSTDDRGDATGISLVLGLSPANALPWEVLWRVRALRDVGTVKLRAEGCSWCATFTGTDDVTATPCGEDVSGRDVAAALLASSAKEDVSFATYLGEDDLGADRLATHLLLRKGILRTLVREREVNAVGDRVILREHPLRAFDEAYILAAPKNASLLQRWLTDHRISHKPCPTDGLPEGWVLEFLPDCSQVTDSARDQIPDGASERAQPRIVRLIGGRSIQRAGLRQFLSYDLPSVELDAPVGTTLEATGLRLTEQDKGRDSRSPLNVGGIPVIPTGGLRRFGITVLTGGARSFTICARHAGHVIGEARLRLAPDGGLATGGTLAFRLDRVGDPTSGRVGLLGVLQSEAETGQQGLTSESHVDSRGIQLGPTLREAQISALRNSPAAMFLDSLAQAGSMSYGVARDQLRRLLVDRGTSNPASVLRELRSRGLIELETDAKGRWVRVHAAPPTICLLSHVHHAGRVVACVSGTLRQQHWRELLEACAFECTVVGDDAVDDAILPAAWLVAPSWAALVAFCEATTFEPRQHAARDLALWAASLEAVNVRVRETGVESLGSMERSIERFVPVRAQFSAPSAGGSLDHKLACQLFRLEDLETGHHQLYTLGYRDSEQRARYSFVRDSRWGVWLALSAFSDFAKSTYSIADASPWPFHLDARDGSLWLPARINLPVVLERTLVLCSGARPRQMEVQGRSDGDQRLLHDRHSGRTLGAVSCVYTEMSPPAPAWSTWLGYRWVPAEIATIVASKLGGQILPFERA